MELFTRNADYPVGVYTLPKHLDEKVARLQLKKLNAQLSELTGPAGRVYRRAQDRAIQDQPVSLLSPQPPVRHQEDPMRLLAAWLINAIGPAGLALSAALDPRRRFRDGAGGGGGAGSDQCGDPAHPAAADAARHAADAGAVHLRHQRRDVFCWRRGCSRASWVDGIWAGIFGSMVYSVISWALTRLLLSSPRS